MAKKAKRSSKKKVEIPSEPIKKHNYSMAIISIVAVVAIIALVLMFSAVGNI